MEAINKKKEDRMILGMRLSRVREASFARSIIVNVISLVLITALVIFLRGSRQKAAEISALRSSSQAREASVDVEVLRGDLMRKAEDEQTLEGAFVDDTGLLQFVQDVGAMQAQGLVSGFNFLSNEAVTESTGNRAIPFQVQFSGDVSLINSGISSFENLPYLIRAKEMEISVGEQITVLYIGYIYVE